MSAAAPSAARRRLHRRPARVALALGALGLVGSALGGCVGSGPGTIDVKGTFSDVSDLAVGAPVQLADITVGNVKTITLSGSGTAAVVDMTVRKDAQVPADVSAELRQTTILGEHYIDLVPSSANGPRLADGAVLTKTEVVPGIQQLVSAGSQVFGAVNAAQVAQIVDNGAQGFGGQSTALRQLLDDFGNVVAGYASRSGEIQSIVNQVDQLSSSLAPSAQANADAISNLAQTTTILARQSDQFVSLLQSLDNLAQQGHSILATGLAQTEDQINALSAVAQQLAAHQRDLAVVLEELPAHNAATAAFSVDNYVQVLDDLIVCGIPGVSPVGASDPSATCSPGGGG
ncbi:MAG TPA: MlaD family protein [Acidimicrobiales bacterium]|nr:MlaD family protein [Acidimicrobiales bacterium]